MQPSEKLLYTRAEAAEMLSLSVSTVDVAVARGMLRARRNGRRTMIEKRELERFSRADHIHIWAPDGTRGTSLAGRECSDCGAAAVRFKGPRPLCQSCFDVRKKSPAPPVPSVDFGLDPGKTNGAVELGVSVPGSGGEIQKRSVFDNPTGA